MQPRLSNKPSFRLVLNRYLMKNWKSIFKNKFPKGRPQCIAENRHEGGILGGEICPDRFDGNAAPGADKERDAVYARCGEVFNAP